LLHPGVPWVSDFPILLVSAQWTSLWLDVPVRGYRLSVVAFVAALPDRTIHILWHVYHPPLGCDQGRRKQGSLLSLWDHPKATGTYRSCPGIKFLTAWHGHDRRAIRLGSLCPSWFARHFGVGNLVPRALKGRDAGCHVWTAMDWQIWNLG
jgi:hypothetical protein